MKLLFIHQNFPGQYKHLAAAFAAEPGNEVVAIGRSNAKGLPGIRLIRYPKPPEPHAETHYLARRYDSGMQHGEVVARQVEQLKREGFQPDIVCAHPGWGEALFIKDILPRTPLLNYCEFYYNAYGADAFFDPEEKVTMSRVMRIRALNGFHLLSLQACDAGMCPTLWQRNQFPREFHGKITVVHDGIDVETVRPDPDVRLTLPNGTVLTRADKVVTYVSRNFEQHRGFLQVMRSVALLCKRHPDLHFVFVGGDEVSYGASPPEGKTWREMALAEVTLDPRRVSFLGRVPYETFVKVLQVSAAHIYLTVPFVLSWSMMEALAAGCVVIGSSTAPVLEVIEDGRNGLLADFFSAESVAGQVERALEDKALARAISERARRFAVERYSLARCLATQTELIHRLAGGAPRGTVIAADGGAMQKRAARAAMK